MKGVYPVALYEYSRTRGYTPYRRGTNYVNEYNRWRRQRLRDEAALQDAYRSEEDPRVIEVHARPRKRRRHRRKSHLLLWFIGICLLVLALVFLNLSLIIAENFATISTPNFTQSNAVTNYTIAREQSADSFTEVTHPNRAEWFVSTSELTDEVGNAKSMYNFLTTQWADARQWCVDNYTDDWPLGKVRDSMPAVNLTPLEAAAIVANSLGECGWQPAITQNGSSVDVYTCTKEEFYDYLEGLGTVGGKAFGIIQHDGGRRLNMLKFFKATGTDPRDLEAQLRYLAYEYYADSYEGQQFNRFRTECENKELTADNFKQGAEAFRKHVERGGTSGRADPLTTTWCCKNREGNQVLKKASDWDVANYSSYFDWIVAYSTGVID